MSIMGEKRKQSTRSHEAVAVFDRRHRGENATMSVVGGSHDITFHRTARDRAAPREVVTGRLLGDPRPGRSAQDKLDALKR